MAAPHPRPLLVQPDDQAIRLIALTQGQVAVVDADHYEWLMQWRWYAKYNSHTRTYYAVRGRRTEEPRTVLLHRQLLGEPDSLVDHWNGDTLDNRLSNLRACTHAQNRANHGPAANNTSGYPGVSWDKARGLWVVRIKVNGRNFNLGYFKKVNDAIAARLDAEHEYFGEFAFSARPISMRPRSKLTSTHQDLEERNIWRPWKRYFDKQATRPSRSTISILVYWTPSGAC